MTSVHLCNDKTTWDEYIVDNDGHPMQLWGWGEVKAKHGWKAERVFIKDGEATIGAAQLLTRPLPSIFKEITYMPRGPVTESSNREAVLQTLAEYTKHTLKSVALTIEPDWSDTLPASKWQPSPNHILIPRTLILDLTKTEGELLAGMNKKTRQYIRKSANDGVSIKRVTDRNAIAECLKIYHQTADRAGFALHDDAYYYDIASELGDFSPVFAAYSGDIMVAFLWPIISGNTLFELYGGMNDDGQQLRANYALKWHVIKTMKEWGIERYDMNGLLNDGVSTFKQSFADHEDMLIGTYDYPLSPLYPLWQRGLPLAKKVIRALKHK